MASLPDPVRPPPPTGRGRWATLLVDEDPNGYGCWIWQGYTEADGTPVVRTKAGKTTARRAVWQRHEGPIPDGLVLLSYCGNHLCVNPRHHEPVNRMELARRYPHSKLGGALTKAALQAGKLGYSARKAACLLRVSERTIRRVWAGDHWSVRPE